MTRRRCQFARVEKWRAGWYAVGKGVCSGPWKNQAEAEHVAFLWNQATDLKGVWRK